VTRLPRILTACLLAGGALAGLLGPGAPAEPRTDPPDEGAQEVVEAEVRPAGEWAEGEAAEPAAPAARDVGPPEPESLDASAAASDADAAVALVRRMLAIHARMGEE
jgi:hypothetical protein